MSTYKEVPLPSSNWSKEDIEYLVDSTFALMAKKKINLKPHAELQIAMDFLREARTAYADSQEVNQQKVSDGLKDLDRQRDLDFNDLYYGLRSQLRSRQANRREAATQLYADVERYRPMLYKSHTDQSVEMKAFFKIMDTPDNQAKLTLVGALEFYTHLKASQAAFDAAQLKRVEGRSLPKQTTQGDARRQLIKAYRTVYSHLLCLEFYGKSTGHQALLGVFNDVRLDFKERQARKAGQAKKKSKAVEPIALLEEPLADFD